MVQILITAGQFLLIIISLFLILVVLMQRANSDGGMGAAFGGGITEGAFGTEAGSVMSKSTWYGAALFFVLAMGLYLVILHTHSQARQVEGLPMDLAEEAAAAPADTLPAANELQSADTTTAPLPEGAPTGEAPVAPQPAE